MKLVASGSLCERGELQILLEQCEGAIPDDAKPVDGIVDIGLECDGGAPPAEAAGGGVAPSAAIYADCLPCFNFQQANSCPSDRRAANP
jgi:hypothetical protein